MEILNFKGQLSDLIYILKKGGSIHIKKKNRGKFTEYCGGKVTEECIAKGKKSKDPKIRKRATFAANARKWKHENGGIIKYQNPNSPLFNPHKIIENVPAREWGPRKINEDGTITEGNGTKFSRAPFQYWGKKGLGSQNEKLARDLASEFDQMRSENPDYNYILDKNYQSYDDAINYLNHLEGLKKYLQLPYDTGLLMESEYKPTRLQGTNEKTYKFKSSTVPGYWDDVVDDMVIGEYDKNQYYDQSLNEFTAYRDRDEKGDFVSIYDEWDYNPTVRGGNKKLNKVVDSVTGGKPFVIYDRIYLDDHYDVPEEARGNPFITPAVVTANAKHENGGVLKAQEGTPYGLPGGAPSYMQVQPFSPVGIALNQAKTTAKMKGEQQYLPPGVKEVVGPDGKKVAIRTEQPLVPLEQSIAEWLPGTGDVAEVGYIANDLKEGRYGTATMAAGLTFLPGNWRKLLDKIMPTKKDRFVDFFQNEIGKTVTRVPVTKSDFGGVYSDGFRYLDESGKEIAHIAGSRHGDRVFVESSFMDPEFRSKGIGKQMYFDFNDQMFNKYGKTIGSDSGQHMMALETSPGIFISPSGRMWRGLRNKGLATTENPPIVSYIMAEPKAIKSYKKYSKGGKL